MEDRAAPEVRFSTPQKLRITNSLAFYAYHYLWELVLGPILLLCYLNSFQATD